MFRINHRLYHTHIVVNIVLTIWSDESDLQVKLRQSAFWEQEITHFQEVQGVR